MDETELQTHRRAKLAKWINDHGGARAACEKRGLKRTTESHISQILGGYSFGPRAARSMESKLGMDTGYLDNTGQAAGTGPGTAGALPASIAQDDGRRRAALDALSDDALEIATWFDQLTDGGDRLKVKRIVDAAVLRLRSKRADELVEPDDQDAGPTIREPVQSPTPKKQASRPR